VHSVAQCSASPSPFAATYSSGRVQVFINCVSLYLIVSLIFYFVALLLLLLLLLLMLLLVVFRSVKNVAGIFKRSEWPYLCTLYQNLQTFPQIIQTIIPRISNVYEPKITSGSQVRILFGAWMCVSACFCVVLSCVSRGLASG
jgi:hypothetical protein